MALQTIEFRIEGIVPCLMGNSRLANPADPIARQLKSLREKGTKKLTDDDYEEMARLQWFGSLYLDDQKRPCWPGENIEAMLKSAAKKFRRGADATIGLTSMGNWPLEYSGPKDLDRLWLDERFRYTRLCPDKKGNGRMLKTSPRFNEWKLTFDVSIDTEVFNPSTLAEIMQKAASYVGLSAWSPKYGRFVVLD